MVSNNNNYYSSHQHQRLVINVECTVFIKYQVKLQKQKSLKLVMLNNPKTTKLSESFRR